MVYTIEQIQEKINPLAEKYNLSAVYLSSLIITYNIRLYCFPMFLKPFPSPTSPNAKILKLILVF